MGWMAYLCSHFSCVRAEGCWYMAPRARDVVCLNARTPINETNAAVDGALRFTLRVAIPVC